MSSDHTNRAAGFRVEVCRRRPPSRPPLSAAARPATRWSARRDHAGTPRRARPEHLTAAGGQHVRAGRHRRPCAGRRWCLPGRRRRVRAAGPLTAARSSWSSWTAVPTVAPTTRPTLPSSPRAAAAAFSAAADVTMLSATLVSRSRACCTVRPSGLEVSASTKTPRLGLRGEVERGPQRLEAEVGAHGQGVARGHGVLAEVGLGVGRHGGADVAALGVEDDQRAGLAQGVGWRPRGSATPREPKTSKKADCGFTTPTCPANASTQASVNRASPSTS